MTKPRTIRVWIPVIVFENAQGKLGYETHGAFDTMVSNRKKRTDCEGDFWSCFLQGSETPEGDHVSESADLHWIGVDVPYPAPRRMILDAILEHGSRSPQLVEKEQTAREAARGAARAVREAVRG